MRISDWSSDVCSSDLAGKARRRLGAERLLGEDVDGGTAEMAGAQALGERRLVDHATARGVDEQRARPQRRQRLGVDQVARAVGQRHVQRQQRSEEHTSELQSLMRNTYAVVGLTKKNIKLLSYMQTIPIY